VVGWFTAWLHDVILLLENTAFFQKRFSESVSDSVTIFFICLFFIYKAKYKRVKQKLKYKSTNIATFKLNTDTYYLEYTQ